MAKQHFLFKLTLLATLVATFVVVLGAYTRLNNAGLGCPDWPTCYGHFMIPKSHTAIHQAELQFPTSTFQLQKAWTEMIHRYFAFALGILILFIAGINLFRTQSSAATKFVGSLLVLLVVLQSLLGMWTVTTKLLPLVVMAHIVGGMVLLGLLWFLTLKFAKTPQTHSPQWRSFRMWSIGALVLIALQIFMGSWVSANYAGLICPGFPFCHGQLFPHMNIHQGFDFLAPVGQNYMGGVMGLNAKISIQMFHRYIAFISVIYFGLLSLNLLFSKKARGLRLIGLAMVIIGVMQFALGVLNVEWLLPIPVAIAHNGFAAIFLLIIVTLNYCVFSQSKYSDRLI